MTPTESIQTCLRKIADTLTDEDTAVIVTAKGGKVTCAGYFGDVLDVLGVLGYATNHTLKSAPAEYRDLLRSSITDALKDKNRVLAELEQTLTKEETK